MRDIELYIFNVLGVTIRINPIHDNYSDKLPAYIIEIYRLYTTRIFEHELVLAERRLSENFSIMQTRKHFDLVSNVVNKKVVLCMNEVTSFIRKRLIEKGINFIIPGKQLFLPELLIDLQETFSLPKLKKGNEQLQPGAQLLALGYILDKYNKQDIENSQFKELTVKFGYSSANSITNAAENLKHHELIDIVGNKEKYIRFRGQRSEIWYDAQKRNLWANPVLKKVYVDELPKNLFLFLSNVSALSEYTDLNPASQIYYAIEKSKFYSLQKEDDLVNANNFEGKYCLEVWNYNPLKLVNELNNDNSVVDPLSLYLSLKDNPDERIEMSLEQIIEKFIW
ncbi:MAG TPA: hypothetical protein VHO46_08165 [Bacteroidales bacterium]|nr:hypothetical protein [Bacteroidales bacterium]